MGQVQVSRGRNGAYIAHQTLSLARQAVDGGESCFMNIGQPDIPTPRRLTLPRFDESVLAYAPAMGFSRIEKSSPNTTTIYRHLPRSQPMISLSLLGALRRFYSRWQRSPIPVTGYWCVSRTRTMRALCIYGLGLDAVSTRPDESMRFL